MKKIIFSLLVGSLALSLSVFSFQAFGQSEEDVDQVMTAVVEEFGAVNPEIVSAYESGDVDDFQKKVNALVESGQIESHKLAALVYETVGADAGDYVDNKAAVKVVAECVKNGIPVNQLKEDYLVATNTGQLEKVLNSKVVRNSLPKGELENLRVDVEKAAAVVNEIKEKGSVAVDIGGQMVNVNFNNLDYSAKQLTATLANNFAQQLNTNINSPEEVRSFGEKISGFAEQSVPGYLTQFGIDQSRANEYARNMVSGIKELVNNHQDRVVEFVKNAQNFGFDNGALPPTIAGGGQFTVSEVSDFGFNSISNITREDMTREYQAFQQIRQIQDPTAQRGAMIQHMEQSAAQYGFNMPKGEDFNRMVDSAQAFMKQEVGGGSLR